MNKKGITLIEMIGVFAILAIVLFLALPNIIAAIKRANSSKYENIEKILKINMDLYVQDRKEDLFAVDSVGGTLNLTYDNLLEANQDINIGSCTVNKLLVTRISTCVADCGGTNPIYSHKYDYLACITCNDQNNTYTTDNANCQQ